MRLAALCLILGMVAVDVQRDSAPRDTLPRVPGDGIPRDALPHVPSDNQLLASLVAAWGVPTFTAATNVITAWPNAGGSCGASCDLSPANSPTVTGGATGLALSLNGSSQYLSVADNAALSLDSKDALFCIWVYPTTVTGLHALLSKDDIATQREYALTQNAATSTQMFSWSDTDALSTWSGTALSINTRAFVCGAIDVSAKKSGGSVNGAAITWSAGAWATGTTIKDGTAAFAIGVQKNAIPANYWAGSEGIAVVYEATTLDFDAVITALYNSGKGQRCADVSTTNLVSCWDLDETSGTRAADAGSCGSTCDLTPTNTPGATAGLVQKKDSKGNVSMGAQVVAASSQNFSVADNSSLSTGDIDLSFCTWWNSASTGSTNAQLVAKGLAAADREWRVVGGWSGTNFFFVTTVYPDDVNSSGSGNSTARLNAGAWGLICGGHVASSSTIWIAVNANARTETSGATYGPRDDTGGFYVGQTQAGYSDGVFANPAFWKRELTADEITSLYASGAGLFYDFAWQLFLRDPIRFAFRMFYDPWQTLSRDAQLRPYAGA